MAMAMKQIRPIARIPELPDKENISPLQDFFYRRDNFNSNQNSRSPLPAGYPRSPLQDITHLINPVQIAQVLQDSPVGCCGGNPDQPTCCGNSTQNTLLTSDEASTETEDVSMSNSSETETEHVSLVVVPTDEEDLDASTEEEKVLEDNSTEEMVLEEESSANKKVLEVSPEQKFEELTPLITFSMFTQSIGNPQSAFTCIASSSRQRSNPNPSQRKLNPSSILKFR